MRRLKLAVAVCALCLMTWDGFASGPQAEQIIVSVTGARLRSGPGLNARVVGASKLGAIYRVDSARRGWYRVPVANGRSAWISATIVEPYDDEKRDAIFARLTKKYVDRDELDFKTASEAFGFATLARTKTEDAETTARVKLNRLILLSRALEQIPVHRLETQPFAGFVAANKPEIVYSEPAGQWLVDSRILWSLSKEYSGFRVTDDIAWAAATNPLPGECEGFMSCTLSWVNMTLGRYLDEFPAGNHSADAQKNVVSILNSMAGNDGSTYEPPNDDAEKAEFSKSLDDLERALKRSCETSQRERALSLVTILRYAPSWSRSQ